MRWPNLGLHALVVTAGGLLTGVFLAFNYAPTLDAARDSVQYIRDEVALGGFLQALHHWAGNFALVLAALHGARLFWKGEYKEPRRALWVVGCLIFLVLVGFAYTGYLLTGDERAYTAMGVMRGIAGSTPVVGDRVARVLSGGSEVSSATLTRIHVVHTLLLPVALGGLVAVFVRLLRKRGLSIDVRSEAAPGLVVLVLLAAIAWLLPPALGPAPDFGGPGATEAKPEWFLLWVNELLRLVSGATFVLGGLLPQVLVGLAIALPWLARGAAREPARRKPELVVAGLIVAGIAGLTVSSLARAGPPEEEEEAVAGAPDAADLDEQAATVMKKFRCSQCHVIDGDEDGGTSGPPLHRAAADGRPPFREIYSRRFFRLKVGDPEGFWPDTGMTYRKGLPTKEQLDTLERWFYNEPPK